MSDLVERRLPIPYAFDTAIGYWTGEPDWELVAGALQAAGLAAHEVWAWIAAARQAHPLPLLALDGIAFYVGTGALVLKGPEEAVERATATLEQAFREPAQL
jgi:hypothetical protein